MWVVKAGERLFLCVLESGSVDDLIAGGPLRIEDVPECFDYGLVPAVGVYSDFILFVG
jgi:hypothetical protein